MKTAVLLAIASARALVSGCAVGLPPNALAGAATSARGRAIPASSRALTVAAAKVLRRYLVEEVFEPINDLFGVLDLVFKLDRRFGNHIFGSEDR